MTKTRPGGSIFTRYQGVKFQAVLTPRTISLGEKGSVHETRCAGELYVAHAHCLFAGVGLRRSVFRDLSQTKCRPNGSLRSVRGYLRGSSLRRFVIRRKVFGSGALGKIRTCDTRFRKPVLYPLSYEGLVSQNRWYVGIFRLSFKSTMSRDSGLGRTWAAPYRASIESARSSRSSS